MRRFNCTSQTQIFEGSSSSGVWSCFGLVQKEASLGGSFGRSKNKVPPPSVVLVNFFPHFSAVAVGYRNSLISAL